MRRAVPSTVEIAIVPHPARPEWSVLRVSYPQEPGHARRIAQALDVLLAGDETPGDEAAPTPHAVMPQPTRDARGREPVAVAR